jgi:2-polyprenyl-6-methoxyphenol hydroxylase-like FAD-dependent oxidoreductase
MCTMGSQLAVPSAGVALVGDAGHGVTPSMGQGCNAALETVRLLHDDLHDLWRARR